eukprot:4151684-Alexandrium_andersonii.AAC.1
MVAAEGSQTGHPGGLPGLEPPGRCGEHTAVAGGPVCSPPEAPSGQELRGGREEAAVGLRSQYLCVPRALASASHGA